MTSDVVLTAALRNNLLSLKSTQSSIDETQLRLATGLKVNSALDNPQSFFASEALKNRASDLTRLLDGLGQNIQVIKAADAGVTALTRLVEQADSIAQSARDALAQGEAEAKVLGNVDLRGIDDLDAVNGVAAGDILRFSITDVDGDLDQLAAYGAAIGAVPANQTVDITIAANQSVDELISAINNIEVDDGNGFATGGQAFEASLDAAGNLQIRTLNGGDFSLDFVSAGGTDSEDLALAQALGFGEAARLVDDGAGGFNTSFSSVAAVELTSFALYDNNGGDPEIAERSDLLSVLEDEDGNALFANIDNAADVYQISINGGTTVDIDLFDGANPISIQNFIDQINSNDTLNTSIRAEFDDATGQLSIVPISADVQSIEIGVSDVVTANFGFGLTDGPNAAGLTGTAGNSIQETVQVGSAAAILAEYEGEFNNVRNQITELVTNGDTGYRGTNLLNGDDLTSFFNEFRTSSLLTEGVTFTADGLGLSEANFSRQDAVDGALAEVRSALEAVRAFGSTLANDLSIIQTRQDFTTNLVNTLQEGSDKLVVADQNEEGTKLLALQTRQQLGVTSLSLASQSQQSILRLF